MRRLLMPLSAALFISFLPKATLAHCPLCTGGAGAAAGVAALLGVSYGAIGVLIGGFAVALSLWIAHMIKKQYFKGQTMVVFLVIYLTTVLPMLPFFADGVVPIYISWFGEFGTTFNRTYIVNAFALGAFIGTVITLVSPRLSQQITKWRDGETLPFQGLSLTLLLLIITAGGMQWWL